MGISIVSILAMTGMFLWMFHKAKFASTRRMALLPLFCAGMEIMAAGMLTPGLFPVLTFLLISMRIVILLCCAGAMKRDAAMAARRARRRKSTNILAPKGVPCYQPDAASGRCA